MITKQDIEQLLENIDNSDENLDLLERAMEFYCSTHDKCEGYKHAIRLCLDDQYDNHPDEQDPADLAKLSDILNGVI